MREIAGSPLRLEAVRPGFEGASMKKMDTIMSPRASKNPAHTIMIATGAGLGVFGGYVREGFGEFTLVAGVRNLGEFPYLEDQAEADGVKGFKSGVEGRVLVAVSRPEESEGGEYAKYPAGEASNVMEVTTGQHVQHLLKTDEALRKTVESAGENDVRIYFCGDSRMIKECRSILKGINANVKMVSEQWTENKVG